MARAGTAARKRQREGKEPAKPGKRGWVHGSKLTFFQAHREAFLAAVETKTTSAFYSRVGGLYLKKYGYHTSWEEDLDEGQAVADDVDPDEDVNGLSAEEATWRAEYFKKLRAKIGVWYNAQYGGGQNRAQKIKTFKQLFDQRALEPPKPTRPRVLQFYSGLFYHERIKPRVDARWIEICRLKLEKPPALVKVRNIVTKEAWDSETPEFQRDVLASLAKQHESAQEAHKIALAKDVPLSAEEYSIALNNAAFYLQPFADAAHKQFGMNIAILIVHAGFSNDLVPRTWNDFDRAGFDAVQSSFVVFTRHCFTEAQCEERAWTDTCGEEASTSGAGTTNQNDSDDDSEEEHEDDGVSHDDVSAQGQPAPPGPVLPSTAQASVALLPELALPPFPTVRDLSGTSDVSAIATIPGSRSPSAPTTGDQAVPLSPFGPSSYGDDSWTGLQLDGNDWLINGYPDPIAEQELGLEYTGPIVGQALGLEIAVMSNEESLQYMQRVATMSIDEMNLETVFAEERARAREKAADEKKAAEDAKRPRPKPRKTKDCRTKKKNARGGEIGSNEDEDSPQNQQEEEEPVGEGGVSGSNEVGSEGCGAKSVEGDGAEGSGDKQGAVWEQDTTEWSEELKMVFGAFQRVKQLGGEAWEFCVESLIALERAGGFATKGPVPVPQGDKAVRPEEVPYFMRYARKWDKIVPLKSRPGPITTPGSFAERWWIWWARIQPPSRVLPSGKFIKAFFTNYY
ncbi:hypothetical protein K438DRAFT_1986598 [Mycena galopus ATCC 62051]|nr:hypothetical protein K438DRAFT_1986598 [Mycena galopus ATCC 62051]